MLVSQLGLPWVPADEPPPASVPMVSPSTPQGFDPPPRKKPPRDENPEEEKPTEEDRPTREERSGCGSMLAVIGLGILALMTQCFGVQF